MSSSQEFFLKERDYIFQSSSHAVLNLLTSGPHLTTTCSATINTYNSVEWASSYDTYSYCSVPVMKGLQFAIFFFANKQSPQESCPEMRVM